MNIIISFIIALVPVFLFLATLVYLDSFKLVSFRSIIYAVSLGIFLAGAAFVINTALMRTFSIPFRTLSCTLAPIIEETLKSLFIIIWISKGRIGFLLDGAILAFAVGSGFSFFENFYYFVVLKETHLLFWIVRGCGTAIMHGGSTAIFAILVKSFTQSKNNQVIKFSLLGLFSAICIHLLFNAFILPPLYITAAQLILLPIFILFVFSKSEHSLRKWLDLSMDSEIDILETIREGRFLESKVGRFLNSLKDKFLPETVVDILCYLQLHLELAVRAKGILLSREFGLEIDGQDDIKSKFKELHHLKKSIGKAGRLAIAPILRYSTRELWHIYFLRNQ